MVPFKAIFLYLSYTLLATGLLLYLQFPIPAVRAYLDGRLSAIDPRLTLETKTLSPTILPPGLEIKDAPLSREGEKIVLVDQASVSPDLLSLLQTNKKINFQVRLAGGEIDVQAMMVRKKQSGRYQVAADFSQVHLDRIDAVKTNDRFSLSGIADGQATYVGTRSGAGKTNGSFSVSSLRVTLQTAVFGIDELVVGQVEGTISGNGRIIRVKTLTFDGPMAEGKITGTIELKGPFGQSLLNLTGNAKPRPELFAQLQEIIPKGFVDPRTLGTRGLNFKINGRVDNPAVSMR